MCKKAYYHRRHHHTFLNTKECIIAVILCVLITSRALSVVALNASERAIPPTKQAKQLLGVVVSLLFFPAQRCSSITIF